MNWDNSKMVHVAKVDNLRYQCQFVSTNDEYVWKDTPDQKSVNACFYNKEDLAETVPYEQVKNVSWTTIQILPGYYARIKNSETHQVGDTPHEATSYIEFKKTYRLDRPPITEETNLRDQIIEVLRKLHGSVHHTTIPSYLNYDKIDENQLSSDETLEYLESLEDSTSIYKTTDSQTWWSIR